MSAGEGLSALFRDYLRGEAKAAAFYPAGAPFDYDRLTARARSLAYPEPRRAAIAADLAAQGNDATRFAQAGTVAVVTGQQVGLLGGPLLGLHKAMTAVLVAERLSAMGAPAVPIFWMATQDHDLAEVNQAWLLSDDDEPLELTAQFAGANVGQSVGDLRLEGSITTVLDTARRCCNPPGATLAADWSAVNAAYRPGATLAAAFAQLLRQWFAPYGLLVFDPRHSPAAAALWQPYYLQAFDRQVELAALLSARAAALTAAGYHVQVEQTAVAGMLFLEDAARRLGLRRAGSHWLLGETAVAAEVMRARLVVAPERVSPAALLRPVLQDVAFPTVAHVVGPAEAAYLAQSAVLYAALDVSQPVAWPRARVTLLDAKAQRLLQKYSLTLDDLRATPAAELLARRALPAGVEQRVAQLRETFAAGFTALTAELRQLDATLVDAAQGAAQKIEHQVAQLEARVARSYARRNQELQAQARHLDASLFPGGHPQERLLAAAGWLARYPRLLELLHARLDPVQPQHQQVALD